jgi:aryl-alcohol dehydrogenase-like predicted oxidoreductase
MRYKILGRSGLKVLEICLGTMTFGEDWGWGGSKEESRKMFDAFVNAGGNFIDTANNYTNGTAETLVGAFIHPGREKYVVATKYTLSTNTKDPNSGGNHKKSLVQSLERSLKRLNTDFIDLFWLHAWDDLTPTDEVMRALDDQVRLGKILHIGVSDTPAWVIAKSNTLAELRGWSSFTALQTQYSLIERTSERELVPMCKALNIAVTAWAPLGGGYINW